jgi:predicted transposase YdaD
LGSEIPYQSQLDLQVQRLYLEDLLPLTNLSPNLAILRLLVLPDLDVSLAAQAILRDPPTEAEFQRRLDLVEAILVNKFPQLNFEEVRQMLDLKEANLTQTRFYQDVLQKGEANLVLRQLQRRCGVLSVTQQELIRSLPVAQLEALGDALLDFGGMADLEVWLKEVANV